MPSGFPARGVVRRTLAAILAAAAIGSALAGAPGKAVSHKGWIEVEGPVPTTGFGTGVRVIDRFGNRVFAEVSADAVDRLRGRGVSFHPVEDADILGVGEERFDVRSGEPPLPPEWRADDTAPAGRQPYLVKFDSPVRPDRILDLERAGAEVVQYQAHFGYLVLAEPDREEQLRGVRHVVFVGAYHPGYKAGAALRAKAAEDETISLRILYFDVPGFETRIDQRVRAGARLVSREDGASTSQGSLLHRAVLENVRTRDLPAILRDSEVYWAEEWFPPQPEDERVAQIVAGNHVSGVPFPGYFAWLAGIGADGTGITVSVADTGLDTGDTATLHEDLRGRTTFATDLCAENRDRSGHGTNVASIAVGDPRPPTGTGLVDSGSFYWGAGTAPGASLHFQKALDVDDCGTLYAAQPTILAEDAVLNGAQIGNFSFSDGGFPGNAYTSTAQAWDARVRDARSGMAGNQQYSVIFSAGNGGPANGSITSPHAAKNVITVGATENQRPGCPGISSCGGIADDIAFVTSWSSRGPTADGRIKPDLVAPGHVVAGARSAAATYSCICEGLAACCASVGVDGSSKYTVYSGTSVAAPAVTGASAVVYQWFRNRFGTFPSPAMNKAILIHGAVDPSTADAPNNREGWGRVDLESSLDSDLPAQYVDETTVLASTGDAAAFTASYYVQDPTRPAKATLAWTDAPGAVSCDPCLVNDLDLVVTRDATTWLGNNIAGGVSTPGGTPDARNNVEVVSLPGGTLSCSPFEVKVRAQALNGDGVPGNSEPVDQDFALVVSNAGTTVAPPIVRVASWTLSGGCDGDSFLDEVETVSLSIQLENVGCTDAAGTMATLSVDSGPADGLVTVLSSGPELIGAVAVGGQASHTWQIALAGGAASLCGQNVPLTLVISDSASRSWTDSVQVPIDGTALRPVTLTDPVDADLSFSRDATQWSLRSCRTTSAPTSWHMGQADCTGIVRDASTRDLIFAHAVPSGAVIREVSFRHAFGGYANASLGLADSVQVDIDPEDDGSYVTLEQWRQGIDNPTSMTLAGPFDLTAFDTTRADTIKIRFRFTSAANWSGGPNHASGWDVDDLVFGYDEAICGGCQPMPVGDGSGGGNPLRASRSGESLVLTWDPVPYAVRYNLYMGTLSGLWDHAIFATTGLDGSDSCFEPTTSATFPLPTGNVYFLVSSDNGTVESNLGSSTAVQPRPYASPACSPH